MNSITSTFQVPSCYTLKEISFRQKGTLAQDEYWEHEEYDSEGNLIARYLSWSCTNISPPFKTQSGYRKYAPDGTLLEEYGK